METQTNEIRERLVRVEEKIDNILIRAVDQSARMDDHEHRIRGLESGKAKLIGIATVATLALSIFGAPILERML